ncbi:hypothetical protein ACJIZ3_001815 [Penstemon smallii]|uniref:Uncharacterized protein n=1 Tax=Penstemon smallii TaxID=265156 RepID=A0ABD3U4R6_9LAMI
MTIMHIILICPPSINSSCKVISSVLFPSMIEVWLISYFDIFADGLMKDSFPLSATTVEFDEPNS